MVMYMYIRPTFTITIRVQILATYSFQVHTLSTLLIDIITLV